MFYPIISQNMRKHTLLIVALLLFTFCEKAFSQNVIVKINIGGEVVSPVTLSTSKGKIIVDGSATFNENISIYSGTDALGRQIVVPLGNSKIATGKPTVREYNIKTVYKPNNEDDEIVDYSSGYENDGNRNITGSVTKTITSGADKFIDTAIDGINFWVDIYNNCSPKDSVNYVTLDQANLYYQGKTAFDFNSGFQISGVETNSPDLVDQIDCAPLPRINEDDPIYGAETSNIPMVVWQNSEHPEICKAFMKELYEPETYTEFLMATPVGMLPSITGISDTEEYQSNPTVQKFANAEKVITETMDLGTAIGFEHGPSVQAGLLTSQSVIENMFQRILVDGEDVETAAQEAEDELNELFSTVQ